MEDGVATVCFATGMAAIGAMLLALLRGGDHVVASSFIFGNTNSLLAHARRRTARRVTFVDATRRRQRRARADAGDAARVRRDDRQSAHAGRRPRAHRRAVPRARHPLRRRQHDDVAVAVPADDRRRGAHRQRADQVHRRPRQRARRRASPTPASSTGRNSRTSPTATRRRSRAMWGITQMRKKGLRDLGGTLAAEQAHHIAVGAETLALRMERQCANAQALAEYLLEPPEGERRPLSRACRRTRSTMRAQATVPRARRAVLVRARDGSSTCSPS